ncbi:MAG: coproporphyrinogen III oxidase, partial [Alphaproteobacteria bacterium HGW-Alphaproteobacteria-12]
MKETPMTAAPDTQTEERKARAAAWFRELRDLIC